MAAIRIKNVHKKFKHYQDKPYTLKERLLLQKRCKFEYREVLRGIDLSIEKGEVVGLIGENGCGKSTLLKLITRIVYPDAGTVEVDGKISGLLELGAGFHPDMTGRENIYMNASIQGMSRAEINERMKSIIAFSELEDFIDSPVRTYSSGMYMRLAFSVAINVNADIVLIDEILAVGDSNFQAKCIARLMQMKASGTTILIVSHDMNMIERLCTRAIWLKDGAVCVNSTVVKTIDAYLKYMNERLISYQNILIQE